MNGILILPGDIISEEGGGRWPGLDWSVSCETPGLFVALQTPLTGGTILT